MDLLPWTEKYRPTAVNEVFGHRDIITTLESFLKSGQLPHILLHGPPGTGKTSVVQAIVRTMFGLQMELRVLEMNASDDRGIGVVRDQIKTFVETSIPGSHRAKELKYKPVEVDPTRLLFENGISNMKQEITEDEEMHVEEEPETSKPETSKPETSKPEASKLPAQTTLMSFFTPRTNSKTEKASAKKPSPKRASPIRPKRTQVSMEINFPNAPQLPQDDSVHPNLRNLKIVVLDEVDQMTSVAQTALRRIMEKHAGNARFFLMCNEITKINLPIQSRCTKFRFKPIGKDFMRAKLDIVVANEKIRIVEDAKNELLERAKGDFRKLLNTLQTCVMQTQWDSSSGLSYDRIQTDTGPESNGTVAAELGGEPRGGERGIITKAVVRMSLGLPNEQELSGLIKVLKTEKNPFPSVYMQILQTLQEKGVALSDLVEACYDDILQTTLPNKTYLTILPRFGDIQCALAAGASPQIQAGCLVAAYVEISKDLP
ncbi:putative replication factor C subunit [Gregarina niphandrodes]|uniref:Replication factor C subunit n=1 Tax=Gregarina niphandrodes TaxID=110365 RepID=A0A023B423_GRENI|nr:putative replication factor C subunit [Gregarina niphandrodes]EZG56157.1 putative replication factor C subunit [Gregarina niphandrodes]|eukprot:XP_011131330.1 putative replication factor C subunit [Gregarina niphandrodes]